MATSAVDTTLGFVVINGVWVLRLPKMWLALSKPELETALKKGKRLKRLLAFEARTRPKEARDGRP